ncbi:MAG: hypothetical protein M1834_001771 [Cirrosporium novae-zelandiae]|nr:MAG: hypothetical protein M1834_001771 [Cirrosporium novae-zelandiae]
MAIQQLLALLSTVALTGAAYTNSSTGYSSPGVYPSPNITGAGGWAAALAKAEAFVAQLTLEEKAYLSTGVSGPCTGAIKPISRLDFDGLCMQDGPTAIRLADFASVFPAGLSVAASWDVDLAYQRGGEMGTEFKEKGSHVVLGPVAGPLGRNALGGRNWEGFSPDPYLTGKLFALTTEGIQDVGAQACGKHFIGNEQETQRNPSTVDGTTIYAVSSNIDDRTMHELYLWPFADGVKSGMASVMCSYNRVNETYSCENSKILNGLLKEELGFQGYVVSDWGGTHSGLPAILAGLDMDMPGSISWSGTNLDSYFGGNITIAVNNGSLSVSRLNDMAKRIMTPYFQLDQDSDYPSVDPSSAEINSFDASESNYNFTITAPAHRDVRGNHSALIRELGAASAVLLKNEGALPLSTPKTIGIFGNDAPAPVDGTNEPFYDESSSNIGALYCGGGSGTGRLSYLHSPLRAIETRAEEDGTMLQYIFENSEIDSSFSHIYPIPEVCLVFLKTYVTEGDDRTSFELDDDGDTVITNVASQCNNTIVITHSGGINIMDWADNDNVTAIIAAHLPGNQMGNSIADILYGDTNPSGKLPYTIAYEKSDYNTAVANVSGTTTDPEAYQSDFTEGLFIDYRHFDNQNITPRYEFGYGLSYTTFILSDLSVSASSSDLTTYPANATTVPGGNPNLYTTVATASVTLSNAGSVSGATVAQLYLYPPSSAPTGTPVKVLRGFQKRELAAGESEEISFELTRKDLSYWDVVAQDWALYSGTMTVGIGFSSRDISVTGSLSL